MNQYKRLDYTLIAEGYAEYSFIPTYLQLVALQYGVQVVRSRLGFKGQDAGKSKVLKEASAISIAAIQQNHQLIIVGIDLDTADYEPDQPKHMVECQQVTLALGKVYKNFRDQIVHFVPVQAIEQWLFYQAYKIDQVSKPTPHSLESKQQSELKKALYKGKENGPNMDKVAQKIASTADFEELAKQSRSFNHFHKQILAFLEQYSQQ